MEIVGNREVNCRTAVAVGARCRFELGTPFVVAYAPVSESEASWQRVLFAAWPWLRRVLPVLLVFVGPVWILDYFRGGLLWSDIPIAGADYDTHVAQTWRVLEGLRGWARSWVYDVQHLAGYPNGTIFDADNKGWTIFTWAASSLGLSDGRAFNLFVICAHLLVAPVVYISCRLFGLRHGPSLCAAGLAVMLWFYDSWNHWEWYIGMTAYAFASYWFLLPLSAFYRFMQERRLWQAALAGSTLALAHLLHPYSFFILAAPMAVLYLREFKTLGRRNHILVWSMAALTVIVNAWWLNVAFSFWHYVLESSLFGHTTLETLGWDFFGLTGEPAEQGSIGNRTGFRLMTIAGGVIGCVMWWRRGDPRALPIVVAMILFASLAYLGGYTPASNLQPYRHIGPLMFLGTVAVAGALEVASDERLWRRISRPAWVLAAVLAIPAAQHLARDILYFSVRALPLPRTLPDGNRVPYTALGYGLHMDYSYADWQLDELVAWVKENDDGKGRILVEGWWVGEHLAWRTDAQILGGFIWRNLEHSWANLFRRRPQGIVAPKEFHKYVRTYAVKWVIVTAPAFLAPWWDVNPKLDKVADIGTFRIYKTKQKVNLVAKGGGRVKARTNVLSVRGSDPDTDVILRYHWLETLICKPDCTVERHELAQDSIGFVRVPAPHPANFRVFNSYRFVGEKFVLKD